MIFAFLLSYFYTIRTETNCLYNITISSLKMMLHTCHFIKMCTSSYI